MSGIAGLWNLNGAPVEKPLLEKIAATLAHRGPDGCGSWLNYSTGLACQLMRVTPESRTESQPFVHPTGAAIVWDGRLDNREELLGALKSSQPISTDSPDPVLVVAAYETWGEKFAERLNGDFALGIFDPRQQKLVLARDAIGLRPLYYYHRPDLFLFGTEIKAILAHPQVRTQPNDDTLAEFLLGVPIWNGRGLDFFENIPSLLPSHIAIVTRERLLTRRYWDFDLHARIRLKSYSDYTERFRLLFEQAVRRRFRSAPPVAISTSGGLDSSSILCVAETLRRKGEILPVATGISYICDERSPADEKKYLLDIEHAYGIPIQRVPMGKPAILDGSREAIWHIEAPFLDEQWSSTVNLADAARTAGAKVLLTGHWADQVVFDQAYLIDLFRQFNWRTIANHLGAYGRWYTDADPKFFRTIFWSELLRHYIPNRLRPTLRYLRHHLRPPRNLPWYSDFLRERVAKALVRPNHYYQPASSAHSLSIYREIRSKYHVLCMEWTNKAMAMHGLDVALPFLDRDLLSFLIAIPGDMQTNGGVPKAILRDAMKGILPEPILQRTWKADFTDRVNDSIRCDLGKVNDFLLGDSRIIARQYAQSDILRREMQQWQNRLTPESSELAWNASNLIGLELWLQTFFDSKTSNRKEMNYAGEN